jgi:hypothetical protein
VSGDKYKQGDAVAGFIHGGIDDPDNGTFQEYVRALPELVSSIVSPNTCHGYKVSLHIRSGRSHPRSVMKKLLPWVESLLVPLLMFVAPILSPGLDVKLQALQALFYHLPISPPWKASPPHPSPVRPSSIPFRYPTADSEPHTT